MKTKWLAKIIWIMISIKQSRVIIIFFFHIISLNKYHIILGHRCGSEHGNLFILEYINSFQKQWNSVIFNISSGDIQRGRFIYNNKYTYYNTNHTSKPSE